jgi:lipopolysaccharide transport system permease protein
LLAPVALLHLIALGTAIGLFLTPISALYQDVSRALGIGLSLWLFLTPVIYSAPKQGLFATLVRLNPVTPLLVTTRELATTGIVSDPQGFWIVSILTFIGLFLGWLIYRVSMPFIIERMSA